MQSNSIKNILKINRNTDTQMAGKVKALQNKHFQLKRFTTQENMDIFRKWNCMIFFNSLFAFIAAHNYLNICQSATIRLVVESRAATTETLWRELKLCCSATEPEPDQWVKIAGQQLQETFDLRNSKQRRQCQVWTLICSN